MSVITDLDSTQIEPAQRREIPLDAVLSGVVTRGGEPAAGIRVSVSAWPSQEIVATLEDGDVVDIVEVAVVETDAEGWFVVPLDPADLAPDFAERAAEGKAPMHYFVDLDREPLVIEDGDDPADWEE